MLADWGIRRLRAILFSVILILHVEYANAQCDNGCYGRGTCDSDSKCVCFTGFSGPECAERVCATGNAWVAKATSARAAHPAMECSNAGTCNSRSGLCECFPGFAGSACERLACPRLCSNAGSCFSTNQLFQNYGFSPYAAGGTYGLAGAGLEQSGWSADFLTACECSTSVGPDCSIGTTGNNIRE
jgi:hypothetical protein